MEDLRLAYYNEILTFSLHTNFPIDTPLGKGACEIIKSVHGINKVTLSRYSLVGEIGFLFEIEEVIPAVLDIYRKTYPTLEIEKIDMKDIVAKAVESVAGLMPFEREENLEMDKEIKEMFNRIAAKGGLSEA